METIANYIESQNFDLLATIKWLLVQDIMYSDEAMNATLYYNPLELSIGMYKLLHANDPNTLDYGFYAYSDHLQTI